MQHGDIWRGLDLLAEQNGLTISGLAKLAGLDATAFNKSKRVAKDGRHRWPSTESIARALEAVQVDMGEFAALVMGSYRHSIPILDLQQASVSDAFEGGRPVLQHWERIRFSRSVGDARLFAIELTGAEGTPIYRAGERIIASSSAEVRNGDRVLAQLTCGKLILARLKRQTANRIELTSFSYRERSVSYKSAEIAWIARILWVSQ